jgi:signal transduction histidine kinase
VTVRAAFAPLVSAITYRRGVHLLLGGVIVLPYLLLGVAFTQLITDGRTPLAATLVLLVVTAAIVGVPAFLRGTRSLEIAAARTLLGVDLPDPPAGRSRVEPETRLRGALWFAVHLLTGGLVGLGLLIALPMALIFIVQRFGVSTAPMGDFRLGPLDEHDTGWLSLIGVLLLVALAYAIAGLGALAALMAPVLLGPSQSERIAALEARAGRLAERNRLARELHDSVGHALTVATLQAAAARELLDTDPEFARTALAAIEETGRGAMEDLDYVLGLLRERDGEQDGEQHAPQRTLADLDRLVSDARGAGVPVTLDVRGPLGEVPAAVSREGYRIVQEGLTNAARHAGHEPVTLRLAVSDGLLTIDLRNPVPASRNEDAGRARPGGGRGLAGMRERVRLLGGELAVGVDAGAWHVAVRLPIADHP